MEAYLYLLTLKLWVLLLNFDWLVPILLSSKISTNTFYFNVKKDNYVYHHWGCRLICF